MPYFFDCYLDLFVYTDGCVKVDDRDELDAAYSNGDINKEQYDRALETADKLMNGLLNNYDKYVSFVEERLRFFKAKSI